MQYKKIFTRIGAAASGLALMPALALADNPFTRAKADLEGTVATKAYGGTPPRQNLFEIAGSLINVALGFLGIVLLGYMLYAGFMWMTSGGETEKAEKALTMIRNAVIGLVIIVAAFAISNFVLGSLINVSSGTTGG